MRRDQKGFQYDQTLSAERKLDDEETLSALDALVKNVASFFRPCESDGMERRRRRVSVDKLTSPAGLKEDSFF